MSIQETHAAPDPRRDTQRERGLTCVATYERVVGASAERVWENVRDWEHLPWLHAGSFSSIACVAAGRWGWLAQIGLLDASEILLELVIEPDEPRYVSRTLAGGGAGSEIWTRVDARGKDETAVHVEFWLKDVPEGQRGRLGEIFTKLYTALWDEDEEMMRVRERALRARSARGGNGSGSGDGGEAPVQLGTLEELLPRLPLLAEYRGERFRIVRHEGELVAHAVTCPHRLGPLEDAPVAEGRITCPWHGYAFDVTTGRECTGRGLRLAAAPAVRVDAETREVSFGR